MIRRRVNKLAIAVGILLAITGGALAYLLATGSGSGSGSAQVTLSAVTVTDLSATQSMLPTGAATGDIHVKLSNGNSSSVHINSLVLDTSQGTSGFSSNASSCALSFASQTNGGNGWTISANSNVSVDLVNSVTMGTSAATSCQGQSFSVYLKAS
jgi:hypothetical protein